MKAYVVRHGAYGDLLHASHIPQYLKTYAGFKHVAFETNIKGYSIMKNNPHIDDLVLFNVTSPMISSQPYSFLEKRWKSKEDEGYVVINLQNSLERGYIAMEDMNEYYMSSEERRKLYGGRFYDVTTEVVRKQLLSKGIQAYFPIVDKGEVYFEDKESKLVEEIYNREYQGKFVIVCNLSGSSRQKLFIDAEQILKTFLAKHPDAVCITVGDEDCRQHLAFEGERIINRCGNFNQDGKYEGGKGYPFRQSMAMASKADLVIGYESGLSIAANIFNVPSIQMMTTSSIKNHADKLANDYSMQSPAACSPCHKGPYEYIGCPKIDFKGQKYPACIKFDVIAVLNQMEKVYDAYDARKKAEATSLSAL